MWVKLDDQLHSHPKIQQAWKTSHASLGLHMLALSYAAAYLTDGHITEAFVSKEISNPRWRRQAVAALVDAGLWEENGNGWVIHDYLDFNDSRQRVLSRRRADSERKRGGRRLEA